MVSKAAQSTEDGQSVVMPRIKESERGDPRAWVRVSGELTNLLFDGKVDRRDYTAMKKAIVADCLAFTGISFEDAARKGRDIIATFIGVMEHDEEELRKVKVEIDALDDARVTEGLKKKWGEMIATAIALQEKARRGPMVFMIYVGRDDDPHRAGEVFQMSDHHHEFFEIWNDPDHLNSLVEAPPGHAKSTSLRYQRAWEIGDEPALRCLYLTDEKKKAEDTVTSLKAVMGSGRFRAVFPDVKILGTKDDAKNQACQFTVGRKNEFAKDATVFAAGILSRIQGRRFDRIDADDICTEDVREHASVRESTNAKFFGVVKTRVADPAHTRIRVIGTPWHPDDVLAKLEAAINQGKLKDWRVDIDQFRIKDDAQGNPIPIWAKFTVQFFRQQQVLDGRNYDLNFRLKPASETFKTVTAIRWYNSRLDPPLVRQSDRQLMAGIATWERWLSIDPAGTAKAYSSDTGAVEIVLSPKGYAFVTRTFSWHCTLSDVNEKVKDLVMEAAMPGYYGIHWEAQGAIKGFMDVNINELRRILKEAGCLKIPQIITTGTMVGGYSQNRGKDARLQSCGSLLAWGAVRLAGQRYARPTPKGGFKPGASDSYPGPIRGSRMEQFANNMLHFDPSVDSDRIDALTQWILNNSHKLNSPYTPQVKSAPVEEVDPFTSCFRKQYEANKNPKGKSDRHKELQIFAA